MAWACTRLPGVRSFEESTCLASATGEAHMHYTCLHSRQSFTPRAGSSGSHVLELRRRCGQTVDLGPYYKRVARGQDLNEAWDASLPEITNRTVHGIWKKDILAGKSGSSRQCPLPEVM